MAYADWAICLRVSYAKPGAEVRCVCTRLKGWLRLSTAEEALLQVCYAKPGTDTVCLRGCYAKPTTLVLVCLRACYALSGTVLRRSGTDDAYGGTRRVRSGRRRRSARGSEANPLSFADGAAVYGGTAVVFAGSAPVYGSNDAVYGRLCCQMLPFMMWLCIPSLPRLQCCHFWSLCSC